jgi:hypothetical protein
MRRIIILDNNILPDNSISLRAVYWVDVPKSSQQTDPNASSIVPGVTKEELSALQAGSVKEISEVSIFPSSAFQDDITARLEARYTELTNSLIAQAIQPAYDGASFDDKNGWNGLPSRSV